MRSKRYMLYLKSIQTLKSSWSEKYDMLYEKFKISIWKFKMLKKIISWFSDINLFLLFNIY